MSLLTADHLAKHYRERAVVQDVSLRVNSGEIVGLLGPNGAGKTTCFYMIVGIIPCEHGVISLNQHELTRYPMHARARLGIGYLPQEPSIFRKLSVADNVLAILETQTTLDEEQRNKMLEELLHEFHITHLRDNPGLSLSGGERRRVEIARALATNPRFILLDEPFAGVDPLSVLDIQAIINHLRNRGIGILITDHKVRETLGICTRAYIMNAGSVIAEGTPREILRDKQVQDVYLGHNFEL
jgi:lipopolysaccharide export system ATP-binding protein